MISRTAEYAVRAMVVLQQHAGENYLRAEQVSELTGIPTNYLSKVLHTLARAGLADSTKGRHGGYRLRRPGATINMHDIVDQFDLLHTKRRCILGNSECSNRSACAAHERWDTVWSAYEQFLKSTTLEELAARPSRTRRKRRKADGS